MGQLIIYIPTFNRPSALYRQLNILSSQIIEGDKNVKIIVRDNNSDKYELSDLEKKFKNKPIIFKKNITNIGANANILLGYLEAKKDDYLWILSDDDLVSSNCLRYIKVYLKEEFDFLIASNDFSEISVERLINKDMSTKYLWYHGLISSTIYRMKEFSFELQNAFYYHNSSFPHLAVILTFLDSNHEISYLKFPKNLIFDVDSSFSETLGDYSLSNVGMPLLIPLMPLKLKKEFANKWAKERMVFFHLNRIKFPIIARSSKKILFENGSTFLILFHFIKGFVIFFVIKLLKHYKIYRFLELKSGFLKKSTLLDEFISKIKKTEFW